MNQTLQDATIRSELSQEMKVTENFELQKYPKVELIRIYTIAFSLLVLLSCPRKELLDHTIIICQTMWERTMIQSSVLGCVYYPLADSDFKAKYYEA